MGKSPLNKSKAVVFSTEIRAEFSIRNLCSQKKFSTPSFVLNELVLPNFHPPVAQKQSSRPIIGRPWCNTKRADQPSPLRSYGSASHFGGLTLGARGRGANACGDHSR